MSERKYSVAEIDKMRHALMRQLWKFGRPLSGDTMESLERRMARQMMGVEDQLRTYMLNGTDPDELEVSKTEGTAS